MFEDLLATILEVVCLLELDKEKEDEKEMDEDKKKEKNSRR